MITNIAIYALGFAVILQSIAGMRLYKRVDELEKRQAGKLWFK